MRQSGMSLLEIMVAIGLLGAVSLGVMELVKNMNKANLSSEQSADIINAYNDIVKLVNDKENCRATFENLNVQPDELEFVNSLNILTASNEKRAMYIAGDPSSRIGKVWIKQMGLELVEHLLTGDRLKLVVTFSKETANGAHSLGAPTIQKVIPIDVDNCARETYIGTDIAECSGKCTSDGGYYESDGEPLTITYEGETRVQCECKMCGQNVARTEIRGCL